MCQMRNESELHLSYRWDQVYVVNDDAHYAVCDLAELKLLRPIRSYCMHLHHQFLNSETHNIQLIFVRNVNFVIQNITTSCATSSYLYQTLFFYRICNQYL